tara:strand:- start:839 stop:1252 length:414 start_codon:yes stop_codon:yes gene_type:complete
MTEIKKEEIETVETIKLMLDNYETLKATCDAMTSDFEKFNSKKIKACGQRVRSNLLTIKKLCDTLRKQIIKDINEIPIKHRIDTDEETTPVAQATPEATPEVETAPEAEATPEITPAEEPPKKVRKPRRANKKQKDL